MDIKGKLMDIRAIVFDVDGTLVNIEERFFHHYAESLIKFGIEPPDRITFEEKRALGKLSDPIPDVDHLRPNFWLAFIDAFSNTDYEDIGSPFPGIPEALDTIKSFGYKLAVVTGRICPPERVEAELKKLGIGRFFDFFITNDNGINGMNKAAHLLEAARRLDLMPKNCAYIGDWEGDVKSSNEAGYGLTVAVLSGGEGREALAAHNPHVIMESAAELPGFLKTLCL